MSNNVSDYNLVFGPVWNGVQDIPCQSYFTISSFASSKTKTLLVQPIKKLDKSCVVMLLHNLADPDWIQISCEEPIVSHVFCLTGKSNLTFKHFHPNSTVFKAECVMLRKECHLLLWHEGNNDRTPICPRGNNIKLPFSVSLYEFVTLLYSVQTIFLPYSSITFRTQFSTIVPLTNMKLLLL